MLIAAGVLQVLGVGIPRAGHGGNNVGLGRRAWALARAVVER